MSKVKEAYPLQWPHGWNRTNNPEHSRFGSWNDKPSISKATDKIIHEMNLFGGTDLIISTELKLKKDGLPYSNQKQPEDRGVAVYFTYQGEQKVIACDSFNKIGCNLWAIAKTIEAMRGIDRWGCSEIITKAFTGFTALPENATQSTLRPWDKVLGVCRTASLTEIKSAYRALVKKYHPDNPLTGNDTKFREIQEAMKQVNI